MSAQRQIPREAYPILLLTFVNAVGGTLLIPVLPFVVRDLGQSDFVFALLIAAYPLAQFFAAPILGSLADYLGRRPILLISQAGTLLSWVLFGAAYFVQDSAAAALAVIAVSRIVDGLTGGNQSVAAAYLADVVNEGARTRVFSLQGAIAGVALLIGPAIGSYSAASSLGFLGPALVAIAISAGTLQWMFLALDESLPAEMRADSFDPNPLHQLNLVSKTAQLTGRSKLIRLFTVQLLFTLTFGGYTTILPLWYVDRLGVSEANIGLLMLATGVFLIFNEMVTLPAVQRRLGDTGTLLFGLSLLPVALFLVRLPASVWSFLPLSFVVNVALALVFPTLQSVITQVADEREEGEVQGINTSVAAIASTIAPVVAGGAYTAFAGGVAIWGAAATAALAAGVGLAARGLFTTTSTADPHHHGPISALAHRLSGGHRSFALHLHKHRRVDHGIKITAQDNPEPLAS